MNRFASAIFALFLVLMLVAACGGGEESAAAEPTLDPNLPTVVPVFTRDAEAVALAETRAAAPTATPSEATPTFTPLPPTEEAPAEVVEEPTVEALVEPTEAAGEPTEAAGEPTEAAGEAAGEEESAEASSLDALGDIEINEDVAEALETGDSDAEAPAAAAVAEAESSDEAVGADDVVTGTAEVDASPGVTTAGEAIAGESDTVTATAGVDASGATTDVATETQTVSDTGTITAAIQDEDEIDEDTTGQAFEVGMYDLYFNEQGNVEEPPVWTVSTGSEVDVELSNFSAGLQHNWVIVNQNAEFDREAPYVPPGDGSDDGLWYFNPGLVDPAVDGEPTLETVTFTAPDVGEYLVICTVAGHYPLMQGRLDVTE